jgi:hypothetical protein
VNPIDRPVRRVVTGTAADGTSVVVTDELVPAGVALQVFGCDAAPLVDGPQPPPPGRPGEGFGGLAWWPPPGGVRVSLAHRPPLGVVLSPAPRPWPDIHGEDGFHSSDSVDVVQVVTGAVALDLDGGQTVLLQAGDVLVQQGTRHRWRTVSEEWTTTLVTVVGALRTSR